MRPEFIERLAQELQLPTKAVETAIRTSHTRIRRITFEKRNGEKRIAYQPAATVKPLLVWLRLRVLKLLPVSPIATAFCEGASILRNAEAHKHSRYSIRVDLKDFFPSITIKDILPLITGSAEIQAEGWDLQDISDLVERICFDRLWRLPIGFPTSPDLANAAMYSIDSLLQREIADQATYGMSAITRYADDFVFSTDRSGACHRFLIRFREILASTSSPKLRINETKTRFMSRLGGSTLITGLRVNNQSEVHVHADYRDHVRLLLHLFKAGRLASEEWQQLVGHLAFVQHADPKFFTKLSFRYADEIAQLRHSR